MDPSATGIAYPDRPFVVDPGRVAAFRSLMGQPAGIPPTFVTAAEFTVFPEIMADPRLGLDVARIVHGSQTYTFHRPLEEGETLAVRARIDGVQVRRGTGLLTIVTELVGSDGDVAVTARSTMVEREAP
jgi:acyl dehydratase